MTYTRATVEFNSQKSRQYIYDDETGFIFPWNVHRENALKSLSGIISESRHKSPRQQYAQKYVKHWIDHYGAFYRKTANPDDIGEPSVDELRDYFYSKASTLVLNITESCNFRCKYCVYSDQYPLSKKGRTRHMPPSLAIRAVDFFANILNSQKQRNPIKRFGISFFGGEPLLNHRAIELVLEHAHNRYPGLFFFSLSTNGSLLEPDILKTLVKYDVKLAISIDGPQEEHDRSRVDIKGQGTYLKIVSNLKYIKTAYPDYWRNNLFSIPIFDYYTDIQRTADFFYDNDSVVPRPLFVSPVSQRNTKYYSNIKEETLEKFNVRINRITADYRKSLINGYKVSPYLRILIGGKILKIMLRSKLNDKRPAFLPYTFACVPGERMAIQTDGTIDMCERVNGRYPIGNIITGIDFYQIRSIINQYANSLFRRCIVCPITKLCSKCFQSAETISGFSVSNIECQEEIAAVKSALSDYVSVLIEKPEAALSVHNDFQQHLEVFRNINC